MPGCGKSTLGPQLAQTTQREFIDLDDEIEAYAEMPIPSIFQHKGEKTFREIERDVLAKLTGTRHQFVLATGGGAPCFHNNMKMMNERGITVFINTPLDVITARTQANDSRPLFYGLSATEHRARIDELFAIRSSFYLEAALITETADLAELTEQLRDLDGIPPIRN